MAQSALIPPDFGVTVGAWNALVRRARIGRERKAAALTVSSYADADGTGIHCGVARLAVDLEIGYSTARRYLAWLRDVGLIELVRHGNARRGLSDEYRLILAQDLLEHLDVPDPTAYDALRNEMRDANRRGQRARRERLDQPSTQQSAACGQPTDRRSPWVSADPPSTEDSSALDTVSAETADQRSPETPSALTQDEPPPPLYTYPEELTSPNHRGDPRPDLAVVGHPQDQDQISPLRLIEGNPDAPQAPPAARPLVPTPSPARRPLHAQEQIQAAQARRAAARAAHHATTA